MHVKAAIKYNDLLKYHNKKSVEPIRDRDKIKWAYLKNNPLNVKALGFKGYDDPQVIIDFVRKYIDLDKLYKGALEKKIKMFYDALQWDMPVDKQNTLERFF